MRTDYLSIALPLMLLLALGPARSATLTPHKATYDVRISVLGGKLTSQVTPAGAGYMAKSVIEPTGVSRVVVRGAIQENSYFLTDEDGVLPEQYRSIDTLSSDNESVSLKFNWRESSVAGTINEREFHAELDGRVHDRLSIQYELMLDLLKGGAESEYSMLDGDELKQLEVRNIGERELETPYGTFAAVGIQHNKKDSTRVTTLWCAKELDYLPVVIEQHRDGKLRVRAVLEGYEEVAPAVAEAE